MTPGKKSRYQEAGVDIEKGNAFIANIKDIVAATHKRGVLTGIGGFSGLFRLNSEQMKEPVLVSSTDGVGTKLAVARLCNRHDTIGIDLVAMCVNDIVVNGARPLFFLDYMATGRLDVATATEVIKGIAKGCEIAQCALIGGETAEMPGMYQEGDYDLAGFSVGIVEQEEIIDGSSIRVGDQIIGIAASGLHSNGYSLVRKICFEEMKLDVDAHIDEFGCTLGEELLRPTRIYVSSCLGLAKQVPVKAFVHITGGGFLDNIPRVLPESSQAVIRGASWPVPPVFSFLRKHGKVEKREMCLTFNNGIGMVAVVDRDRVDDALSQLSGLHETAWHIGEIVKRPQDAPQVDIDCC